MRATMCASSSIRGSLALRHFHVAHLIPRKPRERHIRMMRPWNELRGLFWDALAGQERWSMARAGCGCGGAQTNQGCAAS
jgi:hypothetical protein